MLLGGKGRRAAVVAGLLAIAATFAQASPPTGPAADFAGARASRDARYTADWALRSGDTGGRPFAIVDKKDARLFVFGADGRLVGSSAALLGEAGGDHTVPGIGARPVSQILRHERTTPAGRFASEPGRNLDGEHVVWVEYESGFAIHRLRPGPTREQRAQRLASPTPLDNRISLGCVVVPVAFYEQVVFPVLGRQRGVVYVLPETQSVQALFGDTQQLAQQDL